MLSLLYWLAVIVVASTVSVYVSFMALCTAKRWLEAGIVLRKDMKLVAYALLIVGFPADVVFNYTRGAWMFRIKGSMFPVPTFVGRTFSSRIQFYVNNPDECPDIDERDYWAFLLNVGDPNHIRHTEVGQ